MTLRQKFFWLIGVITTFNFVSNIIVSLGEEQLERVRAEKKARKETAAS